jgi:transposase
VRRAPAVSLSAEERTELERWSARTPDNDRLRMRARIVLAASWGLTNGEIARQLGVHVETVARWRLRFAAQRVEGLRNQALRRRAPRPGSEDLVDRIRRMTVESAPSGGKRWTTRRLARTLNVSHMYVHRVWKAYGLSPTADSSKPPESPGNPWVDVVGMFVDAPLSALVFGVDFRSAVSDEPPAHPRIDPDVSGGYLAQSQYVPIEIATALARADRIVPSLEHGRGSPRRLLKFLRNLDEGTPNVAELHVVFDRPLEEVSRRVSSWLAAHPRFHVRTSPDRTTWSVAVAEWIREFRELPLHPDSFVGVTALADALENASTAERMVHRRFAWTLTARPDRGIRVVSRTSFGRERAAKPPPLHFPPPPSAEGTE